MYIWSGQIYTGTVVRLEAEIPMFCVLISDGENVFITCPKCLDRIRGLPRHLLIGDREQCSWIKHSIFKKKHKLGLRQTQISFIQF